MQQERFVSTLISCCLGELLRNSEGYSAAMQPFNDPKALIDTLITAVSSSALQCMRAKLVM